MEQIFEDCTIEIDCAPGKQRPDSYIEGVLKDTGLTLEDFNEPLKSFGNWSWALKDQGKIDTFYAAKPKFKERLQSLYSAGAIRYASW